MLMFAGYSSENPTREQVEILWAAHGMTVVVLADNDNRLSPVGTRRLNRRITATTPFDVTGPAAGSDLLKTSADPTGRMVLGTLNNCGGGVTPWGTVLSGEENFNQNFGKADQITDRSHDQDPTRPLRPDQRGVANASGNASTGASPATGPTAAGSARAGTTPVTRFLQARPGGGGLRSGGAARAARRPWRCPDATTP
ncbi:alkaline phosphatase PhoX [Saccharopolyspora sp. 5N102]